MRSIAITCGLSLLSTIASAEVVPAPAPQLTQRQIQVIRSAPKTVLPRDPVPSKLGSWSWPSSSPQRAASEPEGIDEATVPVDVDLGAVPPGVPFNRRQVALRINDGLKHIGAEIVPALADEAGLDHLDLVDSQTLFAAASACNDYRLELRNVDIEMSFEPSSVTGHFEDSRKVKCDFDLPSASARAELAFTITDVSSHQACRIEDAIWSYVGRRFEAELAVSDLDGHVDVGLKLDGDSIQVNAIDAVSFSVGDFQWLTNSWLINTIVSLGFTLYDLFDSSCSGDADCLSEAVNQYALSNGAFVDEMTILANDMIDAPLTISTGTSTDGFALSFDVALDEVKSSTADDTMTSVWDVTLGSAAAVDPCADDLSVKAFVFEGSPGHESLTRSDLELEVPFHLISTAAYYAGKQGVFCRSVRVPIAGSSIPMFEITPDGAIAVSRGDAGDPDNTVELSLPLRADVTSSGGSSTLVGTLITKGELRVDTRSDLVLDLVSVEVVDLGGSVSFPLLREEFEAEDLKDAINDAAQDVLADMDDLELLNAVVKTGIGGVSVAVGDITADGQALVVGLDFE